MYHKKQTKYDNKIQITIIVISKHLNRSKHHLAKDFDLYEK